MRVYMYNEIYAAQDLEFLRGTFQHIHLFAVLLFGSNAA